MQPRLFQKEEPNQLSEVQKMLQRKKGFDVIESEELFQQLYNPYFKEWKLKRDQVLETQRRLKQRKKIYGRFNSIYSQTRLQSLSTG